ncbi:hypothetical protein Sango_1242600 [Sesamum angolense]|uniref:Reverse transcriptase Ty1/copia-type domain-containing protein n=1 Tax=Sesamum angolense TaxID=2727404 RepID=A0AAE2BTZ9_9LAMI|nr:hypothetical protein Sango_1242600 [Sesamum angolense]
MLAAAQTAPHTGNLLRAVDFGPPTHCMRALCMRSSRGKQGLHALGARESYTIIVNKEITLVVSLSYESWGRQLRCDLVGGSGLISSSMIRLESSESCEEKQYDRLDGVSSIMLHMSNVYAVLDRHIRYATTKAFFGIKLTEGSSAQSHGVKMLSLVEKCKDLKGLTMGPSILIGEASISKVNGKRAGCWKRKKGKRNVVTVNECALAPLLPLWKWAKGKAKSGVLSGLRKMMSGALKEMGIERGSAHNSSSIKIWHARLWHISKDGISRLVDSKSLKIDDLENLPTCKSYLKGNMTQKPFVGQSTLANSLLDLIYIDVCGSLNTRARAAGVDFEETHSPVEMAKSTWILLAIAAWYDYEIWNMDMKTAFLNIFVEEEIYMDQPKGFTSIGKSRRSAVSKGPSMTSNKLLEAGTYVFMKSYGDMISLRTNLILDSKQTTTTDSTTELKYIVASKAATEAFWMKNYIQELGVVPSIVELVVIFCDNNREIAQEDVYMILVGSSNRVEPAELTHRIVIWKPWRLGRYNWSFPIPIVWE